jgi:hypothetical protein
MFVLRKKIVKVDARWEIRINSSIITLKIKIEELNDSLKILHEYPSYIKNSIG